MEAIGRHRSPETKMKTLGIDFGLRKIGLALGFDQLAQPYLVLKVKDHQQALNQIKDICQKEAVQKIILGVSEGKMADQTLDFGYQLRKVTGLPIYFEDETLTSQEAEELMFKIGKPQKKRQKQIDSISATLILQNFLDKKIRNSEL